MLRVQPHIHSCLPVWPLMARPAALRRRRWTGSRRIPILAAGTAAPRSSTRFMTTTPTPPQWRRPTRPPDPVSNLAQARAPPSDLLQMQACTAHPNGRAPSNGRRAPLIVKVCIRGRPVDYAQLALPVFVECCSLARHASLHVGFCRDSMTVWPSADASITALR